MDAETFYDKVVLMRMYQKEYFRTRSSSALRMSKAYEKEIDDEIARVQRITGKMPKIPTQQDLFK
jgi:hypothetical protein